MIKPTVLNTVSRKIQPPLTTPATPSTPSFKNRITLFVWSWHHLTSCMSAPKPLNALDNLHDVFVLKDVVFADTLGPVLAGGAVHEGVLEVLHDELVDPVTEVLHGAPASLQHHGVFKVRQLSLRLGVNPVDTSTTSHSTHNRRRSRCCQIAQLLFVGTVLWRCHKEKQA